MGPMRWFIGLLVIICLLVVILFYPLATMLRWQAPFLARCFLILFLSFTFCLYRVLKGPTAPDRAVAIDILGILIVGFCALLGIPTGRDWYIDIGIIWALQSFIGTLALAKYLEGRGFDD